MKHPHSLYDEKDFFICPLCQFHFNKRSTSEETFKAHLEKCVIEKQRNFHPEVSDEEV